MSTTDGPRVGRHPGKMPNGIKLAACVEELTGIFEQMPISDKDRATAAFAGMSAIGAGMDFHDASDREPYVARWYLQDAAKKAMIGALSAGRLPMWTDYDGKFIELDPEAMFAPNKWVDTHTILTGTYVALNVAYGRDGPTRAECDGATLWVHNEHWPPIRAALIAERERASGAALPADMMHLIGESQLVTTNARAAMGGAAAGGKAMWSLYEAVAWLGSQDTDLVGQQHPRYFPGTITKNYGAAAWTRLAQSLSDRRVAGSAIMTADEARLRLIAACESGQVQVTGIPANRSERRDVPANEFSPSELWEGRGGSLHRVIGGKPETARWFDLRFDAQAVQRLDRVSIYEDVVSPLEAAPPPLPKKKGRPARYNWPAAMAALTELDGRDDLFSRIIAGEDGVSQADAERFVAAWFAKRGAEPGEASIRRYVADLIQSRRESNAAKDQKEGP